jgi:hypothetical protein
MYSKFSDLSPFLDKRGKQTIVTTTKSNETA